MGPLLFHFNRTLWPILFVAMQLRNLIPLSTEICFHINFKEDMCLGFSKAYLSGIKFLSCMVRNRAGHNVRLKWSNAALATRSSNESAPKVVGRQVGVMRSIYSQVQQQGCFYLHHFSLSKKSSWRMLERPDEDSQAHRTAGVWIWRLDATEN